MEIQILEYQQYLQDLPETTREEQDKKIVAMETLVEFIDNNLINK